MSPSYEDEEELILLRLVQTIRKLDSNIHFVVVCLKNNDNMLVVVRGVEYYTVTTHRK